MQKTFPITVEFKSSGRFFTFLSFEKCAVGDKVVVMDMSGNPTIAKVVELETEYTRSHYEFIICRINVEAHERAAEKHDKIKAQIQAERLARFKREAGLTEEQSLAKIVVVQQPVEAPKDYSKRISKLEKTVNKLLKAIK